VSGFCQHEEKGKRCVLGRHGVEQKHDLQPLGALSAQAIERQEARDRRLSGPERVIQAIDATQPPDQGGSAPAVASSVQSVPTTAPAETVGGPA
jgi:hypothetical protein